MARTWMPGDRVRLAPDGELARLEGAHATVVHADEDRVLVRFDSPKLIAGRLRTELELPATALRATP